MGGSFTPGYCENDGGISRRREEKIMQHAASASFNQVRRLVVREPLFAVLLVLTAAISIFSKPQPTSINWAVITTLFSLMLVRTAFEQCHLLSSLASASVSRFQTQQSLSLALIFFTGLLSMFVTNDVALLTIVPLTILIAENAAVDPYRLIILETISANLFSALTPFGNPQNLYLYSYYKINPTEFFKIMLPLFLFSIVLIVAMNYFCNREKQNYVADSKFEITDKPLFAGALVVFLLTVLAVFRVMSNWIPFVVAVVFFLICRPALFKKVDYFLLGTFVLFFLFTSSITAIPNVKTVLSGALNNETTVFVDSALISQVLSNVPTAVLISGFTHRYRELLYGVSIGGLGTPVASLASVISYKLYAAKYSSGKYGKMFLTLNFLSLILLSISILLYEKIFVW
jgi:Na+/H+ antiporter NhaD/arsenite permease-like protein